MKTQNRCFTAVTKAIALATCLLMVTTSVYATENAKERRGARDTKQDSRQDARTTKVDCRQDDQKNNAECRQDKRAAKQDGREESRDVRSGDESPKE